MLYVAFSLSTVLITCVSSRMALFSRFLMLWGDGSSVISKVNRMKASGTSCFAAKPCWTNMESSVPCASVS